MDMRVLCVDSVVKFGDNKLFTHLTGFTYDRFLSIYNFLVPVGCSQPFTFSKIQHDIETLSLQDQLFLTLIRLRQGTTLMYLSFQFGISVTSAGLVFNNWIDYMYLRLGTLSIRPHRDIIVEHMPPKYHAEYPNTVAIIDCTELHVHRPSSLTIQSQCYSEYKSGTTLKGLIAIDPRGAVIFTSKLFTGSIYDKEIVKQSRFLELLKQLIAAGRLNVGDAIMADKGFDTNSELQALGILLNIPPKCCTKKQMVPGDVELTKKIAAHRVHVERAIARIKQFKLVGHKVPATLFPKINTIWSVCCALTNFQDFLIRD